MGCYRYQQVSKTSLGSHHPLGSKHNPLSICDFAGLMQQHTVPRHTVLPTFPLYKESFSVEPGQVNWHLQATCCQCQNLLSIDLAYSL